MINEKVTMKSEAIFSDDKNHRYILKKEWDKSKKRACVLMINPSSNSNAIENDLTSMLVINNLYKLDFGSVDILNLYSIRGRLSTRAETEEAKTENLKAIMQSVDKSNKIILCFGAIGKSNKTVQKKIDSLIQSLESYRDRVFFLSNLEGEKLLHPLVPEVRQKWNLIPYFKDKK